MSLNKLDLGNPVEGFGSVSGTPGLPDGFDQVFASHLIDVDGVRLHTVIGGDGPPLLLLGGWPQTWYQWRLIMPDLVEDYTVITLDPRGTGLSDKPAKGYDSATLAHETHRLMEVLGYQRFAMISHDIGGWTAYAMAADEPGPIVRLVLAEMIVPGISSSPPLIADRELSDFQWHFNFNRAHEINEQLVEGREHIYFGHQFATKAATPTSIPPEAVDVYVRSLRDPKALHASFEFYRAIDQILVQSERRKKTHIEIPVLAISGTDGGLDVETEMRPVAANIQGSVLAGGHYIPEENPQAFLAEVKPFLAPWQGEDNKYGVIT